MHMFPDLPQGIPLWQDYKNLIFSDDFGEMSIHAEMFLQEQASVIQGLPFRYRYDYLQQWNKRWELPFVVQQAQNLLLQEHAGAAVLDFGSDFSFFPWYLHAMAGCELSCLIDQNLLDSLPLAEAFQSVSMASQLVQCQAADLFLPGLPEQKYQMALCLGCERFLGQLPQIVASIYQSLKPGGCFIFSFDIALTGKEGVTADTAQDILQLVDACFASDLSQQHDFSLLRRQKNILTTRYVADLAPQIMPLNMSHIAYFLDDFLQTRLWLNWPPKSTLLCAVVQKH